MKNRIVILTGKNTHDMGEVDWEDIGIVVTEISELYQTVKENLID